MLVFPMSTPAVAKFLGIPHWRLRHLIDAGKAHPDVVLGRHQWSREEMYKAASALECSVEIRNEILGTAPASGTNEKEARS